MAKEKEDKSNDSGKKIRITQTPPDPKKIGKPLGEADKTRKPCWILGALNVGDARLFWDKGKEKELKSFLTKSPLLQAHELLEASTMGLSAMECVLYQLKLDLSNQEYCEKLIHNYQEGLYK